MFAQSRKLYPIDYTYEDGIEALRQLPPGSPLTGLIAEACYKAPSRNASLGLRLTMSEIAILARALRRGRN